MTLEGHTAAPKKGRQTPYPQCDAGTFQKSDSLRARDVQKNETRSLARRKKRLAKEKKKKEKEAVRGQPPVEIVDEEARGRDQERIEMLQERLNALKKKKFEAIS